jgi:hypothetical protein
LWPGQRPPGSSNRAFRGGRLFREAASLVEASILIKSKLIWIHQKLASQEKSTIGSVFRRPEFVEARASIFWVVIIG